MESRLLIVFRLCLKRGTNQTTISNELPTVSFFSLESGKLGFA